MIETCIALIVAIVLMAAHFIFSEVRSNRLEEKRDQELSARWVNLGASAYRKHGKTKSFDAWANEMDSVPPPLPIEWMDAIEFGWEKAEKETG